MLPVRTTSKEPGAAPPADPQVGAAAGEAPDFAGGGFDPDALEQAAQRLRPSWAPEAGHAEPGEPERSEPAVADAQAPAAASAEAPEVAAAAAAETATSRESAEPLLLQVPAAPKLPNIQVQPDFSSFERGLAGAAGAPPTIIVNEPGVVVLDSPPLDLLSVSAASPAAPAPEFVRPAPEAPRAAPVTPMLSGADDDDLALAPPMKSRAPWLLVAVAAVAVAAGVMFAVRGHTGPRAALKVATPAAKVEPAAPIVPAAAPEPPAAAVAEATPEAGPSPAPDTASAVAAAPAQEPVAPSAEPAPQEPQEEPKELAAAAPEEPAASRRAKRARAAASARQPTSGRTPRASQAKASVEPPAPKPVAAPTKKPSRKGAGFVSTNPYN